VANDGTLQLTLSHPYDPSASIVVLQGERDGKNVLLVDTENPSVIEVRALSGNAFRGWVPANPSALVNTP